MANAIHALSIWILQDEFDLSPEELAGLEKVVIFVVFFYARIWFRAPFVTDWAFLDAELDRNFGDYKT